MAGKYKYDVFLSHHDADKDPVEWISRQLIDKGLTPFFENWYLVPGEPKQEAIERALGESASVAVILGPSGIGPWHNEEMRIALEQGVANQTFRLIPVLLPGATLPEEGKMPPFLSRRTWVDFRKDLEEPGILHRLISGIRGLPPGPALAAPGQFGEVSPYRGLEKFKPEDAPWFFGREAETQQLVERLKSARFLSVIGASGSGKSSLVLAGLVPALQKDALPGSAGWPYRIFTPTAQPLEELAVNLSKLPLHPKRDAIDLLPKLRTDQSALHLVLREGLVDAPADQKVLLVVDQFEEAFTLCQSEEDRQFFINNLVYAAEPVGGRTVVVLTMRADFIAKAAGYAGLADKLSSFQFIVTPLEKEQLRQVIERPAEIAGLQLEPGLTEAILKDVASQPGSLPLLEHALYELWKLRQQNRLTLSVYSEIGGVTGALARTADNTYQSLDESQREIARRILLELVQPGEGTEDTRRRAHYSELVSDPGKAQAVDTVLQRLTDQRLVTINQEHDKEDVVVNVAHEALIRNWPVLQTWINENRESLRFQRKLEGDIEEWRENQRNVDYLYGGSRLAQLKDWKAEHESEIDQAERDFLKASEDREQSERDQELAQQKARATFRQRVILLTVSLVLVLLIAITTGLLLDKTIKSNAEIERSRDEISALNTKNEGLLTESIKTNEELKKSRDEISRLLDETTKARNEIAELSSLTLANQLAAQALANMNEKIDLSLLLAVEGYQQKNIPTTESSLLSVLEYSPNLKQIIRSPVGEVYAIAFSHNGEQMAVGGSNNTIQLFDAKTYQKIGGPLKGHTGAVMDLAFSADDNFLASASQDKNVILWDIRSLEKVTSLTPVTDNQTTHELEASKVIFSPDDRSIITASLDKTFRLWKNLDLRWQGDTSTRDEEIPVEGEGIYSLAWQPGGNLLAVGSRDSSIDLWEVSLPELSFKHLREKPGKTNIGAVGDLAFSPDGQYLVAGGYNSIIRYWPVKELLTPDPKLKKNQFPLGTDLGRHQLRVNSLSFSPGGNYLASAGSDKMVILWDFKNQREAARLLGHQLGVGTVAFNPDGKTLVSGSNDQLLFVWNVIPDPLDQDHPESWLKLACERASRLLTKAELETYFPNQEHKQACETILGGK